MISAYHVCVFMSVIFSCTVYKNRPDFDSININCLIIINTFINIKNNNVVIIKTISV